MEFLDDLREKREAKAKPKTQPEVQRPNTVRRPTVAPRDEKSWDELLASVSFDEPVEVPAPAPKAGGTGKVGARKRGFTTIQMIVLGTLVIALLAFGVVIILYVTGAFHTSSIDLSTDPATTSEAGDTAKGLAGEPAASSLPEATATVESPRPPPHCLSQQGRSPQTLTSKSARLPTEPACILSGAICTWKPVPIKRLSLTSNVRRSWTQAQPPMRGWDGLDYALFRWKDAEAAQPGHCPQPRSCRCPLRRGPDRLLPWRLQRGGCCL